jgi:hypothetical protein
MKTRRVLKVVITALLIASALLLAYVVYATYQLIN